MKRSTARWTTTMAAVAALTALPAVGLTQTPTQQPPASTTAQPPTEPTAQQPNPEVAKQHLTAARNSLSELTQLPAASQLQGDARTQVAQLISNFNEMITTTTE